MFTSKPRRMRRIRSASLGAFGFKEQHCLYDKMIKDESAWIPFDEQGDAMRFRARKNTLPVLCTCIS